MTELMTIPAETILAPATRHPHYRPWSTGAAENPGTPLPALLPTRSTSPRLEVATCVRETISTVTAPHTAPTKTVISACSLLDDAPGVSACTNASSCPALSRSSAFSATLRTFTPAHFAHASFLIIPRGRQHSNLRGRQLRQRTQIQVPPPLPVSQEG